MAYTAWTGASPALHPMLPLDVDPNEPLLALPSIAEFWPILIIVVLLFGARKLPELARAMGSSVTQFRKGLDLAEDDPKAVDGDGDPPKD